MKIKHRMRLRQWYIDKLGVLLRLFKYDAPRIQAKMNAALDKQLADRAALGVQELPKGGFVIWGE